jgi:hypothetical protein
MAIQFYGSKVRQILGIPEAMPTKSCIRKVSTMSHRYTERSPSKHSIHKNRRTRFTARRQVDDSDLANAFHIIAKTEHERDRKRLKMFKAIAELADSATKTGGAVSPSLKLHTKLQHMLLADSMYGKADLWYTFVFDLLKLRAGEIRYKHDVSCKMIFSCPMCIDDDDQTPIGEDDGDDGDDGDDDVCNNFSILADGTKFKRDRRPRVRFNNAIGEFKAVCHTISLCTAFLFSNPAHFQLQDAKAYGYPLALPEASLKTRNEDGTWPVGNSMVDRAWVGMD